MKSYQINTIYLNLVKIKSWFVFEKLYTIIHEKNAVFYTISIQCAVWSVLRGIGPAMAVIQMSVKNVSARRVINRKSKYTTHYFCWAQLIKNPCVPSVPVVSSSHSNNRKTRNIDKKSLAPPGGRPLPPPPPPPIG